MKLKSPFIGILAFIIVLLTMPIGHAVMILMEHLLSPQNVIFAAVALGLLGLALLILGFFHKSKTVAAFSGFFGGLLVWTGWIEFSFVYYADRYQVAPLMENGEIVTKPEYLIMPSSVGFLAILLFYYLFGTKTGCPFFNWMKRLFKIQQAKMAQHSITNPSVSSFMEIIMLLWFFYLVLLFTYDDNFFGDRHFVTYLVAFGSLIWSIILFARLLKKQDMYSALRYSMPTVIIFWNFVEIMGRWEFFSEFWIEPMDYVLEISLLIVTLFITTAIGLINKNRHRVHSS